MDVTKWHYFQYRKSHQYPIYLRVKSEEMNPKYAHLFSELGFSELTDTETKKIQLHRSRTRMLTIQTASARLHLQIHGSDLMDKYGSELLSLQAGMPIYTYRKVGMMGVPSHKPFWELALESNISQTDQMIGLRIMLVRYLAMALSEFGVISYWGTVKDDTFIMMKQVQSFGEAIFIDLQKKLVFSNGGEIRFSNLMKIIRKDIETKVARPMGREELISFLTVNTCLLSYQGINPAMKRSIYELSSIVKASYAISESSINL